MAAANKRVQEAIKRRAVKHGIRIQCLMCSWEGRHKIGEGKLRDRTCDRCGLMRLRPRWWIEKYDTKALAERNACQRTEFLIQ